MTATSSSDESIDEISLKEQIINKVSCLPGDLIIEKHAAKEVTKMLEKHETAAVSRYIKKFLDDWRSQKISIAVYGDKDNGKSQLINTLRGTNSAYTVSSSCTSPMPYVYPFNSNIQFWELPPIARDGRYKKDKYLKEINASRFDLVIILSCNRFAMTSDCWLAKQFEQIKTPVIFARTKVDESVEQDRKTYPHTHSLDRCLARIRKTAMTSLQENSIKTESFYMIGSKKPLLYDFGDFITALVDRLKVEKREAFTLSMIPVNPAVIHKKYEILNSRIWVIACSSAANGQKISKSESKAELEMMLDEVRFYRKQLGAQEDALRKIKDRERDFLGAMGKINYTKEGLEELVRKAEVETDTDMFVTSIKIISLRWWMSHLGVGASFTNTCAVLRFLLHNLQNIGLKYLKIQDLEKVEKEERRIRAKEVIEKARTGSSSSTVKSSLSTKKSSSSSTEKKKKKKKLSSKSDEKEDSGQGTSSGEDTKIKKVN
ncbi:unnamed protein product [Oikopleura dioica]|uniref:IRG-type G domain-containing protein n=1 Tax=Oikopleura dioica TaxID=34765 RepID=E4XNA7_OIKDI|nr:unnamed protein product [Oikopleura dioica]